MKEIENLFGPGAGAIIGLVLIVLAVFWALFPFIVWGKLNQIANHAKGIREDLKDERRRHEHDQKTDE